MERTPPGGPSGGTDEPGLRNLLEFLLYLGSALTAAGEAVNRIEERLHRVAVAASTFLLAGWGWTDADLRAMVAPLVTFLPGAALTMAVIEISAAEMITGASRLVTGVALVSFLPAFWMLVPGALSLMGLTEYLGHDAVAGIQDLLGALGSMIAIALGVLCGYPLYRSLERSAGWLTAVRLR